jgi:hypothetical protein
MESLINAMLAPGEAAAPEGFLEKPIDAHVLLRELSRAISPGACTSA